MTKPHRLAAAALLLVAVGAVAAPAVVIASAASTEASRGTADWRAEYEQKALRQLDDLRAQLAKAESDAAKLTAHARARSDERLLELRRQTEQAQNELVDLQRSGRRQWRLLRQHLDNTLEFARREYDRLRRDLSRDGEKGRSRD